MNGTFRSILLGLVAATLLVLSSKAADAYLLMLGLGAEVSTVLSILSSTFLVFAFAYLVITYKE